MVEKPKANFKDRIKGKLTNKKSKERDTVIVQTSIIGIVANILLVVIKGIIGFSTNSIAIVLDALNNFSDATSSVVTIIGTKLSRKKPDKKHPLGYGRIEYLAEMVVSGLIIFAGVVALHESIQGIIAPEPVDYSPVALIIYGITVFIKLILGSYVRAQGKKVQSGTLVASGVDALFDALITVSVLVSAFIYIFTGVSLEAYLGCIISIIIIKSGIQMMMEPTNQILGMRADSSTSKKIKDILNDVPEIYGAYDLFLQNYGTDKLVASVHIEVPADMTIEEFDVLTRKVERLVFKKTGVMLVAVGAYANYGKDSKFDMMRHEIEQIVLSHGWALNMHGFYIEESDKDVRFDVVLDFDFDPEDCMNTLYEELNAAYPDYSFSIVRDLDISD